MIRRLFLLSLTALLLLGCQPEDTSPVGRYRAAIREGLAAPAAPMETVLGIDLGIPAQEFFDRCTELNHQQLITMSGGGNTVSHPLTNELNRPAQLIFQPVFTDQPRTLQAMELRFIYDDWSPWNRLASADTLLPDAARYLEHTLGTELIELRHPRYQRMFAGVDGNRLLTLWKDDDSTVKGRITDLSTLEADPLGLLP